MKDIAKSLIIGSVLSCLLSSCELATPALGLLLEYRTDDQIKEEKERSDALRREAARDAINLQRFPNLPTCLGYVSPNWPKVAYDERQGYCILRPELKKEKFNPLQEPIARTLTKKNNHEIKSNKLDSRKKKNFRSYATSKKS